MIARTTVLTTLFAFLVLAAGSRSWRWQGGKSSPGDRGRSIAAKFSGKFKARAASDAQQVSAADWSVFFIGNSHTGMHNMPGLICDMIRFRFPKQTAYCHSMSVGFLEDTARSPAYRQEIESRPWKHVVLQAQKISMSGMYDYSKKDGIELAKLAKAKGAKVTFYPEWGVAGKAGDGQRTEEVYRGMAAAAGVGMAPVATAWDLALAERPNLSLHSRDGNHQSKVGAFLTGAVLFGQITGEDPTVLTGFAYAELSEADRKFLAGVAAKALATEAPPVQKVAAKRR